MVARPANRRPFAFRSWSEFSATGVSLHPDLGVCSGIVAVAIRQTVDPSTLLSGWVADGWNLTSRKIITPIPGDSSGRPTIPLQIDAFEWLDVSFFGIGNADAAVGQMRSLIQKGGSDLYAWAIFQRTDLDAFGIRIKRYRLVLCHSIVQLLEAAVAILAIAFAAVIFYQYVTTGKSPAVQDLQGLWSGVVTSTGQAIGQAGAGVVTPYVWATFAAGGMAALIAVASKASGTHIKTPSGPKGSIGVRGGGLSAKVGS